MFKLTYAHCVASKGTSKSEVYELRTILAQMFRVGGIPGMPEDTFEVRIDGDYYGSGETKEDAIENTVYELMARSRREASEA